jgi:hypothetical protein
MTINRLVGAIALSIGMGAVGISGVAIGYNLCSNEEKCVHEPIPAERTYTFSLPRKMVAGTYVKMDVYKSLAEQLSQNFGEVTIQPGAYKCKYDSSQMKIKCAERVIFSVSRKCEMKECGELTPNVDENFIRKMTGSYANRLGQSSIYVRKTPSIKFYVHGGYVERVSHSLMGEEEDFSTLTPFPSKKACENCPPNDEDIAH